MDMLCGPSCKHSDCKSKYPVCLLLSYGFIKFVQTSLTHTCTKAPQKSSCAWLVFGVTVSLSASRLFSQLNHVVSAAFHQQYRDTERQTEEERKKRGETRVEGLDAQ